MMRRRLALLAVALGACSAGAYDGTAHQTLTFIAAQHFNRCAGGAGAVRLTPLQVRYIVKANVGQTQANLFRKVTRWSYYDRAGQNERSALGFIQTRLHRHFNRVVRALEEAESLAERYSNLGRIASYLQEVTSPAHVVPVYTTRWWRFNVGDRFDEFPVVEDAFAAAVARDCSPLSANVESHAELLAATAEGTLAAVRQPIADMQVTWEVFWEIDQPGTFGRYGDAGNNFGRQADFDCGSAERCMLVSRDPIYATFAAARHLEAVRATMTAMWLLQRRAAPLGAGAAVGAERDP